MNQTAMLRTVIVLAAAALATTSVAAQTVDAGMTRAQVVERLGRPDGERTRGPRTFLFYRNGCEQTCGMQDLVVLEDDGVVDAIFRRRGRRYTGESSSPVAVPPRGGVRRTAASGAASADASDDTPARRAPARADGGRRAPRGADARSSLLPGTRPGGIVIGGDVPDRAPDAAPAAPAGPRRIRAAAGSPVGQARGASDSAPAARPRAQTGGGVRVPILPRDTQLGVQPRERGQRTLPGPVTVPTLPRDTQVARPDSAGRRTPAPRRQPTPSRPDSSTSTSSPR